VRVQRQREQRRGDQRVQSVHASSPKNQSGQSRLI
jgi:hypothetical protein